jgi:hypothetical protein
MMRWKPKRSATIGRRSPDNPGSAARGMNRLQIDWERMPRVKCWAESSIGTTGIELPIEESPPADGAFISLLTSGTQIDASAGRDGVNVTVLSEEWKILAKQGFDTTANEFESGNW